MALSKDTITNIDEDTSVKLSFVIVSNTKATCKVNLIKNKSPRTRIYIETIKIYLDSQIIIVWSGHYEIDFFSTNIHLNLPSPIFDATKCDVIATYTKHRLISPDLIPVPKCNLL